MNDVVIVGAGPVGLFAALLLGQRGHTVAVFEKWPTFYPLPRACSIDHEIIRLLQDAGLGDEFGPLLDPIMGPEKTYEFHNQAGETLLQIDWNRPGASGWAQMNMFYQPDLERMLVRHLEALTNVEVRRGLELAELEQHPDHVVLRLSDAAQPQGATVDVQGRYVIGADGARSTVRQQLGIEQTDLGFAYDWLVVDVVPHEERVWKPYVVQHCDPSRPTTLVGSGPGRRRWEFMRLPGETIDELNTTTKAWELLAPYDIKPGSATLERHAVYTFRGAWAHRWTSGQVLLAGDAAHLMPPFLGQGLCAGMRDAVALSWRLSMILRGDAPDALLDSYGPERSEHVREIVRQAVEIGRVICMLDPAEVAARDEQMKAAIKDPSRALKPPPEPRLGSAGLYVVDDPHAGYLSVQGRVRRSGRDGLFDDVVGPGWQLLLRDGCAPAHFDAEARAALTWLGVVTARFGAAGDTVDLDGTYGAWFARLGADVVLVRPDLYVFGTSSVADAGALLVAASRAIADGSGTQRRQELSEMVA
ncbi:bifunctional 3-(3-hydroxy-phenyl)propionate/3-hydroxycinnamic acid hydroxylase [uncultured Sphingomonas sp.]|uniref:bifunctional 3-(3-hydroxy-phenyl)propionate/3-hydroxycinnamic acid hydroxylase MhpA n=1 Tax=uncultured Sphingomonas sp. TaxID=158754 RepID=UPI0035CC93D3